MPDLDPSRLAARGESYSGVVRRESHRPAVVSNTLAVLATKGGGSVPLAAVAPSGCVGVCVDLIAQGADEGLGPRDDALAITRLASSAVVEDHAGAAGQLPREP